MGDAMAITNGKIDGDKFSFDVSFNGMTISHQCTVDGDSIKMTTKSASGDFPGMELTLTRVKETPPAQRRRQRRRLRQRRRRRISRRRFQC